MAYKDLREYLTVLEKKDKLRHVKKEVDKDWELSCIARWVFQSVPEEERYGLVFDHVKGFNVPVVTAILGASRDVYAIALETSPEKVKEKWVQAFMNPIKPRIVKSGPVKEVIKRGEEVNLYEIPIPVWTPGRDSAPYITSPLVITKDSDTGIQNMGTYRMMVKGKNRTGTSIGIMAVQHASLHYFKHQQRNEPMPVAIAIGTDPSIYYLKKKGGKNAVS